MLQTRTHHVSVLQKREKNLEYKEAETKRNIFCNSITMGRKKQVLYPTGVCTQYVFKQTDPVPLQGKLKYSTCMQKDCVARTPLRPYCAKHAHGILGVVLKRGKFGCSLHTTRRLKKGDVIAPYMGRIRAARDSSRDVSPYLMDCKDDRLVVDATLHRSWAAMTNHSATKHNAAFERLWLPVAYAGGRTTHYRRRIPVRGTGVRYQGVF